MKRVIVVISLISLMISGCASVFRLKPISYHYDEIERETTYTTRDLYLIERNVPPYTLKLSVSKSCAETLLTVNQVIMNWCFIHLLTPGSRII